MKKIANLESQVTFLDISFNTEITDEGLLAFNEKSLPLEKLYVNGLTQISHLGLNAII